jgi:hypothetical protein
MYLAVRERLLLPGLTPDQKALEKETSWELFMHLKALRGLIGTAFLG